MNTEKYSAFSQEQRIMNCICRDNTPLQDWEMVSKCLLCETLQHSYCVGLLACMSKYICPNCQLNQSGLNIKVIQTIIPRSKIEGAKSKEAKLVFPFIVNFNKLKQISDGCHSLKHFLSIQCLRFDRSGFTFEWPLDTTVSINGRELLTVPGKSSFFQFDNKPVVFSWNEYLESNIIQVNHYPYDNHIFQVSDYLFNNRESTLELSMGKSDEGDIYCITGDVIEVLNEETALQKIKVIKDKALLVEFIKQKSPLGLEEEIVKERISLNDVYCPKKRIELPGRGLNCRHLSVFDVKRFLKDSVRNRSYSCPICNENAHYVYIDGFIQDIINCNPCYNRLAIDKEYDYLVQDDSKDYEDDDAGQDAIVLEEGDDDSISGLFKEIGRDGTGRECRNRSRSRSRSKKGKKGKRRSGSWHSESGSIQESLSNDTYKHLRYTEKKENKNKSSIPLSQGNNVPSKAANNKNEIEIIDLLYDDDSDSFARTKKSVEIVDESIEVVDNYCFFQVERYGIPNDKEKKSIH